MLNPLRDCWYMAGWSADFPAGALRSSWVNGEPLVLFREGSGALVALEDRCCHRLAPLSHGTLEGDSLRCMYHGLRFAPDGRCVEVPGKSSVPAALRVRKFPVVERHSAAWVWLGDPSLADDSLVPPFVGIGDPTWAMHPGHMDYEAPYKLIEDNLLDLSHVPYVHAKSFGRSDPVRNAAWAEAPVQITELPRGIHVQRWLTGSPAPPHLAAQTERVDTSTEYDFLAPGVFLLHTRYYRPGAAARAKDGVAIDTPLFENFSCQAVTPRTADKTTYFFAYGPQVSHAAMKDAFRDMALKAFGEDRVMIEAQQQIIKADPSRRMVLIDLDRGPALYDRVAGKLLEAETQRLRAIST